MGVLLALAIGGVYAITLHPGVGRGDTAELQYVGPLLGVCHPPGYAIEVTFARLFNAISVGPSVAWRINLMMAVCGTIGCLLFYGTVRRITGRIWTGCIAAGLLAFSNIYWQHSVLAEVYVFYAVFLLLATYATARFLGSDRAGWLFLTAGALGVCVGDRISEVTILPAFAALWWFQRRRVHLNVGRIILSLVLFVLPFAYSVTFFWVRNDPAQTYARDDATCRQILEHETPFQERPFRAKLSDALKYCLGLKWAERGNFSMKRLGEDVQKYGWLLSGAGGFGDRYERTTPALASKQTQQGSGSAIGGLALLFGAAGIWRQWKQWQWIVFGAGLFAGNLAFYLGHQAPDNLDFVIPGLAGIALLVALGMDGLIGGCRNAKASWFMRSACLAAPLFLLITNYIFLTENASLERARIDYCTRLAAAPLPRNCILLSHRNSGMVYRYLYHVEAGRTDVMVINADPGAWPKLVNHLMRQGRIILVHAPPKNERQYGAVVMPGDPIPPELRSRWLVNTPRELAGLDFLRVTSR